MSDPDDYEALPATASLGVTCFAGALAGIAEHCVMFPIDSVKVRRSSLSMIGPVREVVQGLPDNMTPLEIGKSVIQTDCHINR